MKTLKTEIIINASAKSVWNILMDFEAYSNWNPFITKILGEPQVNNSIEAHLKNGKGKEMKFKPVVLQNQPQKEFRWKGKLGFGGIFDGEHYFKLESIEEGKCRFIHGENFSGILVKPLLKMVGEDTLAGFNSMNQALKNKAENQK